MIIDFISDLHLCVEQPQLSTAFLRYLQGPARDAQSLWILGDLFEYWVGDDDLDDAFNADIAAALSALAATGTRIQLIVGNRDFLIGERFAQAASLSLLSEAQIIELGDKRVALMHGDAQCTDDAAYQQFRSMVRNPAWQQQFLAQPRAVRQQIAAQLRAKSEMAKSEKERAIMDVNAAAIQSAFETLKVDWIIHGHTHRPDQHRVALDGREGLRHVLPDWRTEACGLRWRDGQLSPFVA